TIGGGGTGAQFFEGLKRRGGGGKGVGYAFIFILLSVSAFLVWESWETLLMRQKPEKNGGKFKRKSKVVAGQEDESAFSHIAKWIQKLNLPPRINLPVSGIKGISLWVILLVSYVGGIFSGFLGGGAGYIRMPAMVYLLGVPTHVA